jgi:site-specific DNA-cytosine methylase
LAKKKLRFGSGFTGIGGGDEGFVRQGFDVAFQIEIDPYANAVLDLQYPGRAAFYDIKTVEAEQLRPCDVFGFGSPCQDLSVAGPRAGLDGDRSVLFYEGIRIIRDLRRIYGSPSIAIWENVPGALSSNDGADFEAVLRAFQNIGALDVAWAVLDARWFGVPQRRRRVYVVADFAGQRAEEILSLAYGVRGSIEAGKGKKKRRAGQALDSPSISGDQRREILRQLAWSMGLGGSRRDLATAFVGPDGNFIRCDEGTTGLPAPAQSSLHSASQDPTHFAPDVGNALTAGSSKRANSPGRHSEDDFNLVASAASADQEDVTSTVAPNQQRGPRGDAADDSRLVVADVSPTIIQSAGGTRKPGGGNAELEFYVADSQVEAFTIRECDRDDDLTIQESDVVGCIQSKQPGPGSDHEQTLLVEGDVSAFTIQTNDAGEHKRQDRPDGGMYIQEADASLTVGSTDQTVVAIGCIHPDALHRSGRNTTPTADADGRVRLRDPGMGINDGDDSFTLNTGEPPSVAVLEHAGGADDVAATVGQRMRGQDDSCARNLLAVAFSDDVLSISMASDPLAARNIAQPVTGRNGDPGHITGKLGVRRLTPVECSRLQGFKDDWNAFGLFDGARVVMSDSQRYKQMGNAINVEVFAWIAGQAKAVLARSAHPRAVSGSRASRKKG